MIRFFLVAAVATMLVGPPSARAAVIYSDFGPGDTFTPSQGFGIRGSNVFGGSVSQGAMFTAGATGLLGEIDVAFFYASGSGQFNLSLYTANSSGQLGTLIETIMGGVVPTSDTSGAVIVESSLLHPLITAGTSYFLIASAANSQTNVAWNYNSTGTTGTLYSSDSRGVTYSSSTILPTFRLQTSAVPEPSSLVLSVIAGGLGIAGRWRKKRVATVQLMTS